MNIQSIVEEHKKMATAMTKDELDYITSSPNVLWCIVKQGYLERLVRNLEGEIKRQREYLTDGKKSLRRLKQ